MSFLSNALATADQLSRRNHPNALPVEVQDSIRFYTARLTQAAGILLRLPQSISAQAVVLLFRYWLVDDLMKFEFSDVSAAVVYLTAKVSASPRTLRSVTNVYAYLLSSSSSFVGTKPAAKPNPESYYLSESTYIAMRNRLLNIEGQVLNALGFHTQVALPHPLTITYLQALDVFGTSQPHKKGSAVAKRAMEYLNTALLSPQMLYLTHQPNALAVTVIYLAARDVGAKLPNVEWWEVFDTDREELGFLALGVKSLEGWVQAEKERWGEKTVLRRADIKETQNNQNGNGSVDDEESEMATLLDRKVASAES